jgi:hypothetical protein
MCRLSLPKAVAGDYGPGLRQITDAVGEPGVIECIAGRTVATRAH